MLHKAKRKHQSEGGNVVNKRSRMESVTTDQVNKTLEIADYSESREEKESLRFIISCYKLNEITKDIEVKI